MEKKFLPVFSLDWSGFLERLQSVVGDYGILAPISSDKTLLNKIRSTDKLFFIDSGVFDKKNIPWYKQNHCEFKQNRWVRELRLTNEEQLRIKIKTYLDCCDRFSPDYVFGLDILGEPILSLARICLQEYWQKSRTYKLIGVVQVGAILYDSERKFVPTLDSFLPHYQTPKSFLISLISEYRYIGYQHIALGGLLKKDKTMPTGLKFGLSPQELDKLLTWSRPEFVLGGLALSSLDILKKHQVWADSTNWLWWNKRYDYQRFGHRNALQEVVGQET